MPYHLGLFFFSIFFAISRASRSSTWVLCLPCFPLFMSLKLPHLRVSSTSLSHPMMSLYHHLGFVFKVTIYSSSPQVIRASSYHDHINPIMQASVQVPSYVSGCQVFFRTIYKGSKTPSAHIIFIKSTRTIKPSNMG